MKNFISIFAILICINNSYAESKSLLMNNEDDLIIRGKNLRIADLPICAVQRELDGVLRLSPAAEAKSQATKICNYIGYATNKKLTLIDFKTKNLDNEAACRFFNIEDRLETKKSEIIFDEIICH